MPGQQYYLTDDDRMLLKNALQAVEQLRRNPTLRPSDEEVDLQPPEVYVALTPMGGIPALGGSGTDVDAVATVCEIYRLLPSSGTDPGSGLQDAGFTRPIYNLYAAWGGNEWVKVSRDKWGTWWTDPHASSGSGFSDGNLGDVQFADGSGGFLNAQDAYTALGGNLPLSITAAYMIDSTGGLDYPYLQMQPGGLNLFLGHATVANLGGQVNVWSDGASALIQHFSIALADVNADHCQIKIGCFTSSGVDTVTIQSRVIQIGNNTADSITVNSHNLTFNPATGTAIIGTSAGENVTISPGILTVWNGGTGSTSFCEFGVQPSGFPTAYMGKIEGGANFFSVNNVVVFCSVGHAIDVQVGDIQTQGISGGTYVWGANTTATGTQLLATLPLTIYGSDSTTLMGGPVDWVLINVGGTNRKIGVYPV